MIFGQEAVTLLRASGGAAPPDGAKAVVRAFGTRVLDVPVADEGVWTDVDTPDEYRAALQRFGCTA